MQNTKSTFAPNWLAHFGFGVIVIMAMEMPDPYLSSAQLRSRVITSAGSRARADIAASLGLTDRRDFRKAGALVGVEANLLADLEAF